MTEDPKSGDQRREAVPENVLSEAEFQRQYLYGVKTYQKAQARFSKQGNKLYGLSLYRHFQIFSTCHSFEEIVATLRTEGIETDVATVIEFRTRYLRMVPLRPFRLYEKRQREIVRRQKRRAELEQQPFFRHLDRVCKEYGLGEPQIADIPEGRLTYFVIDGLLCNVYATTKVHYKGSLQAQQKYAQMTNPLKQGHQLGDFCVFLVEVTEEDVQEEAAYFVPSDMLVSAAYKGRFYVPIGQRTENQSGVAQKIDWERYSGKERVRALFNAAKQRRAVHPE